MKKFLLMASLFTGLGLTSMAQEKSKKIEPAKPTSTTAINASASKATAPAAKSVVAPGAGTPLKADGTPDKRYKVNKAVARHVKKDGTPDKRFKENKAKP